MSGALHVINTKSVSNAISRRPLLFVGISTLLAVEAPKIVTMAELIDWLWGDDPDGGPEYPEGEIRVAIAELRSRWRVPIQSHGSGRYSMARCEASSPAGVARARSAHRGHAQSGDAP